MSCPVVRCERIGPLSRHVTCDGARRGTIRSQTLRLLALFHYTSSLFALLFTISVPHEDDIGEVLVELCEKFNIQVFNQNILFSLEDN